MNSRRRVLGALGVVVFVAIIYGPVLALLPHAADGPGTSSLLSGRQVILLLRSLGLAAAVAGTCTLLGLPAAGVLWQWRVGPLSRARWLTLAFALIPPYVHALVWLQVGGLVSGWLQGLGLPPLTLHGWLASWFVEVMAHLPLSVGLTLLGLHMVDPRLLEAGRMQRPDAPMLRAIAVPLAAPAIAAGAALIFILNLTDYAVPSLLSVNVYAMDVFAEYSATGEVGPTLLLALPLVVIAAFAILACHWLLGNAASVRTHDRAPGGGPLALPAWLSTVRGAALALLIADLFVVFLGLVVATGGLGEMRASVASSHREIGFTLATSLAAGVLCLPLVLLAAAGMSAPGARGWWWRLLVTAPLAVPAPLIGVGLIALLSGVGAQALNGQLWLPAIASLVRFTPFAAFVVLAQVRRVDPALVDAARVLHTRPLRTWGQVILPMLAPGLLAAGAVVFALAAGELGATLIVAPPGWATVTMRVYNLLHYGGMAQVTGLCLMMALAGVLAGGLAAHALARWSRMLAGGEER